MIPYSFGGESVNENAMVALPRSPTEMLFGRSLSGWIKLFSAFGDNTTTSDFVVVSLTRDGTKWTIFAKKKKKKLKYRRGKIYEALISYVTCYTQNSYIGYIREDARMSEKIFMSNAEYYTTRNIRIFLRMMIVVSEKSFQYKMWKM